MNTSQKVRRVIALGFFDGVHIGHGALLRRVAEIARHTGAVPSAFTFDTRAEGAEFKNAAPLLSTPADRVALMRRYYGIRDVIVVPFDEHMKHMPWREFVSDFLVGRGAVHLVAGHDFRFGYRGEGNPERLKELCRHLGLGCDIIPKVEQDHIAVSSTYIRMLVERGELERVCFFLGHPHTLGMNCAGLADSSDAVQLRFAPGVLAQARGVYACRVWLGDRSCPAATAVGAGREVLCLPAGGRIGPVGDTVRLEFHGRLRGARGEGPGPERPDREDAARAAAYLLGH